MADYRRHYEDGPRRHDREWADRAGDEVRSWFAEDEARKFFGPPPKFSAAIEREYLTPWPAGTAETRFKERFAKLLRG